MIKPNRSFPTLAQLAYAMMGFLCVLLGGSSVAAWKLSSPAWAASSEVDCSEGFRGSGQPELDALRLAMGCASRFGLLRQSNRLLRFSEDIEQRSIELKLGPKACFVLAISSDIERIEAELSQGQDKILSVFGGDRGWLLLPNSGQLICTKTSKNLTLSIRSLDGEGSAAVEFWLLNDVRAFSSLGPRVHRL